MLAIRDVFKVFVSSAGAKLALRSIDLSIREASSFAFLAHRLWEVDDPEPDRRARGSRRGEVLHHGVPVTGVNTRVGYVAQDDNLLPWRTTVSNVELALEIKGVPRRERRERAIAYLERVGLGGFEHHYPHQLSGGMRKRASIVRTLIDETTDVILMDEPFGRSTRRRVSSCRRAAAALQTPAAPLSSSRTTSSKRWR